MPVAAVETDEDHGIRWLRERCNLRNRSNTIETGRQIDADRHIADAHARHAKITFDCLCDAIAGITPPIEKLSDGKLR